VKDFIKSCALGDVHILKVIFYGSVFPAILLSIVLMPILKTDIGSFIFSIVFAVFSLWYIRWYYLSIYRSSANLSPFFRFLSRLHGNFICGICAIYSMLVFGSMGYLALLAFGYL